MPIVATLAEQRTGEFVGGAIIRPTNRRRWLVVRQTDDQSAHFIQQGVPVAIEQGTKHALAEYLAARFAKELTLRLPPKVPTWGERRLLSGHF
jgi:hypothetical protein